MSQSVSPSCTTWMTDGPPGTTAVPAAGTAGFAAAPAAAPDSAEPRSPHARTASASAQTRTADRRPNIARLTTWLGRAHKPGNPLQPRGFGARLQRDGRDRAQYRRLRSLGRRGDSGRSQDLCAARGVRLRGPD